MEESQIECRPRCFGRVSVVPGPSSESPAHLQVAGTGNVVRHGVEPGEADELAGREDFKRPQPVPLLVEALLEAVDGSVTFHAVLWRRKIARDFGICVEIRERSAV